MIHLTNCETPVSSVGSLGRLKLRGVEGEELLERPSRSCFCSLSLLASLRPLSSCFWLSLSLSSLSLDSPWSLLCCLSPLPEEDLSLERCLPFAPLPLAP